jgi:hypothetical protein
MWQRQELLPASRFQLPASCFLLPASQFWLPASCFGLPADFCQAFVEKSKVMTADLE